MFGSDGANITDYDLTSKGDVRASVPQIVAKRSQICQPPGSADHGPERPPRAHTPLHYDEMHDDLAWANGSERRKVL